MTGQVLVVHDGRIPFFADAGVALGATLLDGANTAARPSPAATSIEWTAAVDEREGAPLEAEAEADADTAACTDCTEDWRGGGGGVEAAVVRVCSADAAPAVAVDEASTSSAPESTLDRFCFLERAACCASGDGASDSKLAVGGDNDDDEDGSDNVWGFSCFGTAAEAAADTIVAASGSTSV